MFEQVLKIFFTTQSFLRIFAQYFRQKVFSFIAQSNFLREFQFTFLDKLEHCRLRLVIKWWKSKHHLIGQNTQWPPISKLVISSTSENFRSQILRCSAKSICKFTISDDSGHSEICQRYISKIVHQHILQFQISVNKVFWMKMSQSQSDLRSIKFGLLFWESFRVRQMLEKLSSPWN